MKDISTTNVMNSVNIQQIVWSKGCKILGVDHQKIRYVCRCRRKIWDTLKNVTSDQWNGCPNCRTQKTQHKHVCISCSDRFFSYNNDELDRKVCTSCRRYPNPTVFPIFSVFNPNPTEKLLLFQNRHRHQLQLHAKKAIDSYKKIQFTHW